MTEKRKCRLCSILTVSLLLLVLLFSEQKIQVQAAGGQAYRALLVTRGDYQGTASDLTPGPQNDGENVKRMLQKAYGEENITISVRDKVGVTTKAGLKSAIQTAFGESKAEDINYFYYSGHGEMEGLCLEIGTILSPEELYDCFDGILGTNVIIMDCCYSGSFSKQTELSEGNESGEEISVEKFTEEFTDHFEAADADGRRFRTVLNNSRFRMLLAASEEEVSNQTLESGSTPAVGMFTSAMAYGSGIDAMKVNAVTEKSQYDLGVSPADYDGNGEISYDEICGFIENCCVANHIRMYPAENEERFLPAVDTPGEAAFGKACVTYHADGSADVKIACHAREDTTVELAYYYSEESWEIQNLLMRLTDASGLPALSTSGYPQKKAEIKGISIQEGDGALSFCVDNSAGGLQTGFYGCLIRPSGSKILYMVPFAVSGLEDSILKNMKLEASKTYCLQSGEEWEILADFGTYSEETLARPAVSCSLYDSRGNLVRTLGDCETAQVIAVGLTQNYRCLRRFYWDGCGSDKQRVTSGVYTAEVTAWDPTGSIVLTTKVLTSCGSEGGTGPDESKPQTGTPKQSGKQTEAPKQSETQTDSGKESETDPAAGGNHETGTGTTQVAVKNIQAECVSAFAVVKKGVGKIVIGKKEKVKILPLFTPANAAGQTISYDSSNSKVVSVGADGTVKAKKTGNAVITLRSENGKTCRVKVTVRSAPTKLKLNAVSKTLKKGKSFQIKITLPARTASYSRRYISSNKKVVSVSAAGKVTARKKGKAVITVKLYNGKKARLRVTVK